MPRRRRALAPPTPDPSPSRPPPPSSSALGSAGEVATSVACLVPACSHLLKDKAASVLLETPSGFAIFYFCRLFLDVPGALQNLWVNFATCHSARKIIWLKEFQTFDDKSSAINVDTGVNKQLTEMIVKYCCPQRELIVGKPEYKSTIETRLGILCRHDELTMEVMWGLKRLMPSLVRREKSELPKEDRLPMSQGLHMLLSRYGFDVKPEMVNEQIVVTTSVLFDCDAFEEKRYPGFRSIGRYLKKISGIDCKDWDLLKLATAFKIICSREIDDSGEMFSEDVQAKLLDDADKYEMKIDKSVCLLHHKQIVSNYQIKTRRKDMLAALVMKAKEAHEAELAEVP